MLGPKDVGWIGNKLPPDTGLGLENPAPKSEEDVVEGAIFEEGLFTNINYFNYKRTQWKKAVLVMLTRSEIETQN